MQWLGKLVLFDKDESISISGDKWFCSCIDRTQHPDWQTLKPPHADRTPIQHAVSEQRGKSTDENPSHSPRESVLRTSRAFDGQFVRGIADGAPSVLDSPASLQARSPGRSFDSIYLRGIGWFIWDRSGDPEINRRHSLRYLPEMFDLGTCELRDEEIDGKACTRIDVEIREPFWEHETVWLDKLHGDMVVRRECSEGATQSLLVRYRNDDPIEVLRGFWLPRHSVMEQFAPPDAPPELRSQPMVTTEITADVVAVNDVRDDLFEVSFPPGSNVVDFAETHRRQLKQPLMRAVAADGNFLDSQLKSHSGLNRMHLLLFNCVLLFTVMYVFLKRRAGSIGNLDGSQ